jgi:uncharacterized DUF497 family protein
MDVSFRFQGQKFVWDVRKATANLKKHKVAFETACEVFFDPFVLLVEAERKGETREAALGLTENWSLLYVVHVLWEKDSIRIISARNATKRERKDYENG